MLYSHSCFSCLLVTCHGLLCEVCCTILKPVFKLLRSDIHIMRKFKTDVPLWWMIPSTATLLFVRGLKVQQGGPDSIPKMQLLHETHFSISVFATTALHRWQKNFWVTSQGRCICKKKHRRVTSGVCVCVYTLALLTSHTPPCQYSHACVLMQPPLICRSVYLSY